MYNLLETRFISQYIGNLYTIMNFDTDICCPKPTISPYANGTFPKMLILVKSLSAQLFGVFTLNTIIHSNSEKENVKRNHYQLSENTI